MIVNKINDTVLCHGTYHNQYLRIGQVVFISDITDVRYGQLGEVVEIRTKEDANYDKNEHVVVNLFIPEDEIAADMETVEVIYTVDSLEVV